MVIGWVVSISFGVACGLFAMALHEAGHAIAAVVLGAKIKKIGLRWQGIYIIRDTGTPITNLAISLAGPSTNLLLCLIGHRYVTFAMANLCFAVCNLLPISGSDGERALKYIKIVR